MEKFIQKIASKFRLKILVIYNADCSYVKNGLNPEKIMESFYWFTSGEST